MKTRMDCKIRAVAHIRLTYSLQFRIFLFRSCRPDRPTPVPIPLLNYPKCNLGCMGKIQCVPCPQWAAFVVSHHPSLISLIQSPFPHHPPRYTNNSFQGIATTPSSGAADDPASGSPTRGADGVAEAMRKSKLRRSQAHSAWRRLCNWVLPFPVAVQKAYISLAPATAVNFHNTYR